MKRLLIVLAALPLAACVNRVSISPVDINKAISMCAPNGGLTEIVAGERVMRPRCNNGAQFAIDKETS